MTIVEIMGRDAGWLTAASALGRSAGMQEPDLIYLPERVFSMEQFLGDVRTALSRHPNVVVAVSEGIRFADGTDVGAGTQSGAADVFGHKYLAGTAKALEMAVKAEIGCKVRSVELNLPQRCASHMASAQDLAESVAVGKEAVRAAVEGVSCEMMTIQRTGNDPYTYRIGHADVEQIANRIKYVDDAFINEAGNGVTDACCLSCPFDCGGMLSDLSQRSAGSLYHALNRIGCLRKTKKRKEQIRGMSGSEEIR